MLFFCSEVWTSPSRRPHDRPRIIELTTSNAEEAQRGIPALLAARGLALRSFEMVEPTLEEVFVDLVSAPDR